MTKTITISNANKIEQGLLLYNVSYNFEFGNVTVRKIKEDLIYYFKENGVNKIKQLVFKNKNWKHTFEKTKTVEMLIEFKDSKTISDEWIIKELKKRRRS